MKFLLDTDAVSEIVKKQPHAGFLRSLRETRMSDVSISAVSVFEIRHGCRRRGADRLWERIQREVIGRVQVHPIGIVEAERAGDVLADLERRGTPIALEDLLIGSTALAHGAAVVTRNVRDLTRIPGLRVENWWIDE